MDVERALLERRTPTPTGRHSSRVTAGPVPWRRRVSPSMPSDGDSWADESQSARQACSGRLLWSRNGRIGNDQGEANASAKALAAAATDSAKAARDVASKRKNRKRPRRSQRVYKGFGSSGKVFDKSSSRFSQITQEAEISSRRQHACKGFGSSGKGFGESGSRCGQYAKQAQDQPGANKQVATLNLVLLLSVATSCS